MARYLEAIEQLPEEFRFPVMKALELLREDLADTVKKSDFEELKAVVKELAEAQKRTEERVEELAEAQKRTEQRVNELAEAQKRTEERLTRLEHTVQELAEAQKRTEEEIKKLTTAIQTIEKEQTKIKAELGGLSHTVGYRLEDEAFKALPALLKQDFGITIKGRLKRDFIEIGPEKYIEVNIWGEGKKNGKEYTIIGEAKSQLKKKDIDEFLKKLEVIKRYIPKKQFPILVTYIAHPQVQRYAKEKNIKLYFSYEF